MTGLLAGSFPELNLEALLSSYLAEGNDKIREDLAGTSLESDAIVRLKMAADAVSSAFQAMNNAAKGVLKKMDRDLSTLWSRETPISWFKDMPQGTEDQVLNDAIALAKTELQESLRNVPHLSELIAKRSGKRGHWNTASHVKMKLNARLRSMANEFVIRKGREHAEFVDGNRKLASLLLAMVVIVAVICFITALEGWEATITCAGVLVVGAGGIALFAVAIPVCIQAFPLLIALMVIGVGGQVQTCPPRNGRVGAPYHAWGQVVHYGPRGGCIREMETKCIGRAVTTC